jgi:hypothetical protein
VPGTAELWLIALRGLLWDQAAFICRDHCTRSRLELGVSCHLALPRWAGALFALSTVLAPMAGLLSDASQPRVAIPLGLALA